MMIKIIKLVSLLVYLTITSFLIPSVFGKYIGTTTSIALVCMNSFINMWIASLLFIYILISQETYNIQIHEWLHIEMFNIKLGFLIDSLSVSMLLIITLISFCASIYSIEYLNTDPHLIRYYSYLSLFTFFMIILVLAPNLLQLFIGWEGVGICSYLLINFWFCRYQANKASLLAIFANKIGDITLILAILLLQSLLKNIDFKNVQNIIEFLIDRENYDESIINIYQYIENNNNEIEYEQKILESLIDIYNYETGFINFIQFNENNLWTVIIILLILSAVGKSAQFGFHLWLPEAMEGPTPVSSLIHAATMVTAGIFLILRNSELIINIKEVNLSIILIGSTTLFFSASIGIAQNDLKKIVAYSTCSQLGYMFLSCGFNNYTYSMYHLFIHAFFKALLFLTAGYILHFLSNEQDIRKMGSLLKIMPLGYILIIVGSYSLSGLPFLSGYYSKEPLLESIIVTIMNDYLHNLKSTLPLVMLFAFSTILLTLIYSLKSIIDIFYFSYKGYKYYLENIGYSNTYIQLPLVILAIASIYSGYIFSDLMIGLNNNFLVSSISINQIDSIIKLDLEIAYEQNIQILNIEKVLVELKLEKLESIKALNLLKINENTILLYNIDLDLEELNIKFEKDIESVIWKQSSKNWEQTNNIVKGLLDFDLRRLEEYTMFQFGLLIIDVHFWNTMWEWTFPSWNLEEILDQQKETITEFKKKMLEAFKIVFEKELENLNIEKELINLKLKKELLDNKIEILAKHYQQKYTEHYNKSSTEVYILEYFPYYRTYAIVLLSYTLLLYILLKYIYIDYFVILTTHIKKLYIINYILSKKYISYNRLIITTIVLNVMKDTYLKIYRLFDKGIIELFGPYGITLFLSFIMRKLSILQTSYLYHYIGYFYISLVVGLSIIYYFV